MGGDGARPEDDRRRHRNPRPHPRRLREGGSERGPALRAQAAHLRDRRRRADRRRARRRHRRARAQGDRPAISGISIPRPPASCSSRPGRGCWPRFPKACRNRRRRSSRSSASRCGSAMRSRNATSTASCSPTARRSARAACFGRPASWPRAPRNGLGAEADRAGRVIVDDDLSVPGHPEILVIGDTALVKGADGQPVPGVAPAAKQMGRYVARPDQGTARRQADQALPLRRLRQPRHDRPQGGGRRFRPDQAERLHRLAAVELCPSVVPGRLPQPHRRLPRLGLGLCNI